MDKAFDFLATHPDMAFATVGEDNRPKLRVFQVMKRIGTTLFFATSKQKEVYRQLSANPYIELLGMDGNISLRLSGKASFDVEDDICRAIYNENPILQRLYESYQSLVYFRMPIYKYDYYDLSTNPPTLDSKTLIYEA